MRPPLIPAILIIVLDQSLKYIIFKNIPIGISFPLIKGVLYITPIYNRGVAFGLLRNQNLSVLITAISIMAIITFSLILKKARRARILAWGLFLILPGALSNLIDRIMHGHVLDFIDLRIWPIFNIADSAITVGTCLILAHIVITAKHRR